MAKRYEDLTFDNGDMMVSLRKLTGKAILDIAGMICDVQGFGPIFIAHRVDFEDGTHLNVEGEHDMAWLRPGDGLSQPGFATDELAALAREIHEDEDDE